MNHNFEKLKVWQVGVEIAVKTYQITSDFPEKEKFGLTNQLRRASVSISSNIAEGAGRNSNKEYVHFLGVAIGSLNEIKTQFIISQKLGFIKLDNFNTIMNLIEEEQKMLFVYRNSLKQQTDK